MTASVLYRFRQVNLGRVERQKIFQFDTVKEAMAHAYDPLLDPLVQATKNQKVVWIEHKRVDQGQAQQTA